MKLHSVCEEARCPNISECFSQKLATFLILGDICTRNCQFCSVKKGKPNLPDPQEPYNLARAVEKLGLNYVVITSVSRDDLEDGGVGFFIAAIRQIRKVNPTIKIEILIPDFSGAQNLLELLIREKPNVINHNLETVQRLYPVLRDKAKYRRSLLLLKSIKNIDNSIMSKSGMMLGLGETEQEVMQTLYDLREVDCDFLTMGQYLQPSCAQFPVKNYIAPERFEFYKKSAQALGFKYVMSSPYTRSSYQAHNFFTRNLVHLG